MENWLSHLKVLDLSTGVAGSFCSKLLGQLGAEVIKVEYPIIGDPSRGQAPLIDDLPDREGSASFLYLNGGKRSITLDVSRALGKNIFCELVKDADVLVETFRPGFLQGLNLGYENLCVSNPGLINVSITDFGQTGPYADYKSNELIQFALSGLLYATGFPEEAPVQSGGFLPQYKGGLVGAFGALAALQWRDLSGEGQQVDVSVLDVVCNFLETNLVLYSYQGIVSGRNGSTLTPPTPFCDMYECLDGYLIITVVTHQQMESLYEMIGHPEFIGDPDMIDPRAAPIAARNRIWDSIRGWAGEQETDDAFELCQLLRVPCAKVMTSKDLLSDKHLVEREFFRDADHPTAGVITYPTTGFRVQNEHPITPKPAPLLGEANWEIYHHRLGFSDKEIELLGVVGAI